jgi:hypothetical protein
LSEQGQSLLSSSLHRLKDECTINIIAAPGGMHSPISRAEEDMLLALLPPFV